MVNVSDEQLTIRIANSWKVFKNLEIGAEFNGSRLTNHNKNSLERPADYLFSPYPKLADDAGNAMAIPKDYRITYVDTISTPGLLGWKYFPLQEAGNGNRTTTKNNSRMAGYLNFLVLNGLTASVHYQWQKESSQLKDIKTNSLLCRYIAIDRDIAFFPLMLPDVGMFLKEFFEAVL